ncbi:hypothetical protein PsYK624_166700 [Phanerochaete sordida]|uniref:Mixed lineage kinase domain-containing protein n=1 Tax=Phanerochaete sordida TaxID=48140 RepID=A0A9P3GR86_9APHY|nr:hypothetical protein PsYK624_166700 [Phanerochaete sordida]
MPLRAIRKRCTADNALTIAIAATTASHELAGLLAFPPVRAASAILLAIFKTIQDMQNNKRECFRLAKRCVTLLADVKAAMDGHWGDAPAALLANLAKFERTLESLHADLQRDIEGKWHDRLLRKGAIETALGEYHAAVDDAARSLQIVTLIHIHRAVGDPRVSVAGHKGSGKRASDAVSTAETLPPYSPARGAAGEGSRSSKEDTSVTSRSSTASWTPSLASRSSSDSDYVLIPEHTPSLASSSAVSLPPPQRPLPPTPTTLVDSPTYSEPLDEVGDEAEDDLDPEEQAFLAELALFDDKGFQRYDSAALRPSRRKKARLANGWWAGAREVEIEGRTVLMVPYAAGDESHGRTRAARRWLRDVKTLQNVYHPNLPEMIGYSGTDAPTPFILLANVQTRLPQALLLSVLANASLLECATLLIGFYKETLDAALYLQRQLALSESQAQDHIERAALRIAPHSATKVVVGLPDPAAVRGTTYRNFGLAWSVRDVWLAVLPNRGRVGRLVDLYDALDPVRQEKANHLALLARTLLPGNDAPPAALARLDALARAIAPPPAPAPLLEDERDEMDDLLDLYGDEDDADAAEKTTVENRTEKLTLRRLRDVALRAGTHGVAWSNNFVPPYLFRVGDVGYIRPQTSKADTSAAAEKPEALWAYGGFDRFVRVCNVLDDAVHGEAALEVRPDHGGWTMSFDGGRFEKTELQAFEAGGGVLGWPILTSPGARLTVHALHCTYTADVNAAWALLLARAPALARMHGVRPEELMLVTRSGTELRLKVHDVRSSPPSFGAPRQAFPPQHAPGFPPRGGFAGQHGFPGHHHHMHGFAPPPPLPSYVFTSEAREFGVRVQDTPVCLPQQPAQAQAQGARCVWVSDGAYGFMNYVRLCAEDFD